MTQSDVPADWYPNPADNGASERYWDGHAWTTWTRARSPQVTGSGDPEISSAEDQEYIPAGWYPDPDTGGATARYWDGNDWTERTRATLRPTPGPLAGRSSRRASVAVASGSSAAEQEPGSQTVSVGDASAVDSGATTGASAAEDSGSAEVAAEPDVVETETAESDRVPESTNGSGLAEPDQAQPAQAEAESVAEPSDVSETAPDVEADASEAQTADAEPTENSAEQDVAPEPEADDSHVLTDDGESSAALEESPESPVDVDAPPAAATESLEPPADTASEQDEAASQPGPAAAAVPVAKQGPGSYQPPAAAAQPSESTAQRGGFHPLERLRSIRRKDEPATRGSGVQWAPDPEAAEAYRQLEFNRLDLLLGAVWEQAMNGDVHSVQAATRLIEIRCRLMGVDVGNSSGELAPPPLLVARDEQSAQHR